MHGLPIGLLISVASILSLWRHGGLFPSCCLFKGTGGTDGTDNSYSDMTSPCTMPALNYLKVKNPESYIGEHPSHPSLVSPLPFALFPFARCL